jgi:LysR family transcriptional regulator, nod-box dependent transcriptional activator
MLSTTGWEGRLNVPKSLYGVDMNLLVALDALLCEQNVTRAAARLGVTQPAMSNALARLRRLLDDEILVRVGREWQLTPKARAVKEPLERMLGIARDEVLGPAPFDHASSQRRFRIATANSSAVILVAPLVARLSRVAPGVVVQVVPVGSPRNDLLDRPDVDVLLLPDFYGIAHPNVHLLSLEWTCLVDVNHPFSGDRFDRASFVEYPHVVYEHDGVATQAHSSLVAHGLDGSGHVIVDDFILIPFLLQGSHFVGLLQDALAERILGGMSLRRVKAPVPLPGVRINMYWNARNEHDPAHQWLREQMLEIGQQIR